MSPPSLAGTYSFAVNIVVGGVRRSRRLRLSTALTAADCSNKNGEFLDKNDDVSNIDKETSTTGIMVIVSHDKPSFDNEIDSSGSDEEPEGNNNEDGQQEEPHEEGLECHDDDIDDS